MNRQEQIKALKAIEKPFSLWPKDLQECEFVREDKHRKIWEYWQMGQWSNLTDLDDSCLVYRLSPDYKEPGFEDYNIVYDDEGRMHYFDSASRRRGFVVDNRKGFIGFLSEAGELMNQMAMYRWKDTYSLYCHVPRGIVKSGEYTVVRAKKVRFVC